MKQSQEADLDGVQMSGWGYTRTSPLVDGKLRSSAHARRPCARAPSRLSTRRPATSSGRARTSPDKAGYSSLIAADIGGVHQYVQY